MTPIKPGTTISAGNDDSLSSRWSGGGWQRIVGAGVVCGFAALWGWMGACALPHAATAVRIVSILISIALLVLRAATGARPGNGPVDRRLLRITIAGEVAALWIMGLALGKLGRADLLLPGLAIIVGLHFVPMAKALKDRAYLGTAIGMTAVGLSSLALTDPYRTSFTGLACAAILWVTIALPLVSRR